MTETSQTEELRRYIFLDMSEAERDSMEERLFEDTDFFYEMVHLENELIDGYVRRRLTGTDLEKFESSLAKLPERREKVDRARILRLYIANQKKTPVLVPSPSIWERLSHLVKSFGLSYALGALVVLLVCTIALLLYQNRRTQQELTALQNRQQTEINEKERILQEQIRELENLKLLSESERGQNEILNERIDEVENQKKQLEQELKSLRQNVKSPDDSPNKEPSPPPPVIASFFLLPSPDRGSAPTNIMLKPNTSRIDLSLELPPASKAVTFGVRLNGSPVAENQKPRVLPSGRRVITVSLPAAKLDKGGDYRLTVTGNDGFEDNYSFRLQR